MEAAGFQTEVQSGLTLAVGQEAVINFALQVGQATQTVSVTSQATMVDTTTSSLSSLVTPTTHRRPAAQRPQLHRFDPASAGRRQSP